MDGGDFRVAGVKAGKTTDMSVLKRPGHAPKATAGSEFVVISPTEQLRLTEAAMAQNMQLS